MEALTIRELGVPIYDIVFSDSFGELKQAVQAAGKTYHRICIVSDSRVASLYLQEVKAIFQEMAEVIEFVFPEGEASKNLQTVSQLYEKLIQAHFDRKDLLVALGGGVTGDLTGYAAATYLRGIDFMQIPTSLLAQVDSSIGGKTGVDFKAYKNMVGAFHMPVLVYMNFSVLKSLSARQFSSGMAEIIKHGLIKDLDYYEWIRDHRAEIMDREVAALAQMVRRSCEIKGQVVNDDPREQGERALLNFGHTLGHAVEKLEDFTLLHGECVSIGIAAAAAISCQKGLISADVLEDIRSLLQVFGLPVRLPGVKEGDGKCLSAQEIVDTTKSDKKMESGRIKFILLSPAGHAVIDKGVTDEQLFAAAVFIGAKEEKA